MPGARRFLRWLFVSAAAAQVLLPAAASVADGLLQREELTAGCIAAHVEDFGSTKCKRIHADDCALCRVVTATASPSHTPAPPSRVARLGLAPVGAVTRGVRAVAHALPASRAPPLTDRVAGQRA
jgi:hypothetical protein